MTEPSGVHLRRSRERVTGIDALADRVGGRVGVAAALGDLNRAAEPARVPGRAVLGFRWDREDRWSRRWYPQGITSTADRDASEQLDGRELLCTSWYARDRGDEHRGARITFVDLRRLRYRHVLLVEPVLDHDTGRVDVRPVTIHAGGLAWYGDHLHVAATARGICTFRLDDIVRVPPGLPGAFGYRYLLPLRVRYDGLTDGPAERLRFSFLSVDRSSTPHHLVAGEYGRRSASTRLGRYELDGATSLLRTDEEGRSVPVGLTTGDLASMQGVVTVDGISYVSVSAGRFRRGSLYVGRPGSFREHAGVLPTGPEDLTYWPSTDRLWSLTEYPGRRHVFALDRSRLGGVGSP